MVDLEAVGIRTYNAEPDRRRPTCSKTPEAQTPVYGTTAPARRASSR